MKPRAATFDRRTTETRIRGRLVVDGRGFDRSEVAAMP